jgi:5'(3')-deoxyribonucleotidase
MTNFFPLKNAENSNDDAVLKMDEQHWPAHVTFDPEKNIIFLDMDDVLADFTGAAIDQMQQIFPDQPAESYPLLMVRVIDRIKYIDDFFYNLRPFSYAVDLYKLATSVCRNVQILTAIPEWPGEDNIKRQKIEWVLKYLGPGIQVNFGLRAGDKWKHARQGDILIDDNASNILDWETKGGALGILHNPANPSHTTRLLMDLVQ